MSVFFVDPKTISAVLTLVLMNEGPKSTDSLNELGKSLWVMNALAFEAAYKGTQAESFLDEIKSYKFEPIKDVGFLAVLRATEFFLYQCEEGDVPNAVLFKRIDQIFAQYEAHTKSDEYREAPWGLCG